MNKVILIGRLSRDPQLHVTQNQKKICNYTIAVDRPRQKDQEGTAADFISCVCFDKMAEFAAQAFAKGIKLAVVGRLSTRTYIDKNTQKNVYVTEVIVESQEFVESKEANQKYKQAQPVAQQAPQYDPYVAQQQYQQPIPQPQAQPVAQQAPQYDPYVAQQQYQQPIPQPQVQAVPQPQVAPQPMQQPYQQPVPMAQPSQPQPMPEYGLNLGADDLPF